MRDLLSTSYLFFYNSFIQNLVFRMLALELRNNLLHPLHDLHTPLPDTMVHFMVLSQTVSGTHARKSLIVSNSKPNIQITQ